ncbi:hypothetical protein PLICRDRAFT_554187 [Plicaturopsis crispa FD-325 SS-3]|nr:hypothetical protein PLICRDRAFT_554187 [Plicaturopsis crispa FD-325 SS-3]
MFKVVRDALLLSALLQSGIVAATPLARASAPTITLDDGTFTGTTDGNTDKFLGIPFAEAPVGDLRFNLPKAVGPYSGNLSATTYGLSCPQQSIKLPLPDGLAANATDFIVNSIFQDIFPYGEDCLQLNVVKPANATADSKLPVVVWIFGGGFELGSPTMYDGGVIVKRSIALNEPVIYVSMNYRVTAFGFLASQEVKDAGVGNLGLQDQRLALRWVQKYIGAFGGDPAKVTIWGESAGAISVALQMLTNGGDTEGLFRAGFMESGAPIPVGDITHGQKYYDAIVDQTGCSGASDTLNCLRDVPYQDLLDAINNSPGIFSYQSLILAWLPRADGIFLKEDPQVLVASGSVANIPIVSGNCDDEGTLFSLSSLNVTTSDELKTYLHTEILTAVNESTIDRGLELYPDDITQGSPFDTGVFNAITPEFKRIAAFFGDAVFQGPRRYFLQKISGKQKIWSYVNKRVKDLPVLGSAHATDILNVYADGDMTDYLINFVNNLDPNGAGGHLEWPEYTTASPQLMTFQDGLNPALSISSDDYRVEAMAFLTQVTLDTPI